MLSDDELVEQILLGNENAAEELIKRYYTSILRYCRWHCSNLEKAEDLTQETFLKLFKNLSGYKGKKKFKAYLYTIANHLCIDESRKVEFYPLEDEENIVHEYNDIVRLEDRAEISYFLNFLSSEQREAVILRFGEQLSFGEIPTEYIKTNAIPLNSNGKKDIHKILIVAEKNRKPIFKKNNNCKQLTQLQEQLLAIWREVLKIENIDINDNFFEIGGNSIQAIQITNQMTEKIGCFMDIGKLFEYPTISKIERYILEET